jgi:uncharacterized protein YbbC (DUF1343 family)
MGELAKLENGEKHLNADLHVVEMAGWNRADWFDATGLPWVNPSPNIRNLNQALLYPGLAMLESSTNYSVGRGSDAPFEEVGADWIDGRELARYLSSRDIPGVRAYPLTFKPGSSNFSGKAIEGIGFVVTNRDIFSSSRCGLELALALARLYPGKIRWDASAKLLGNQGVIDALAGSKDALPAASAGIREFLLMRRKYLLYR